MQAVQPSGIQTINEFNTPFQHVFHLSIPQDAFSDDKRFDLPAGKTLVVEFVSADGNFPAGEQPTEFILFSVANNVQASIFLNVQALNVHAQNGHHRNLFVPSQQIRLYAKESLGVQLSRDVTAGNVSMLVTVIGYLVDTP